MYFDEQFSQNKAANNSSQIIPLKPHPALSSARAPCTKDKKFGHGIYIGRQRKNPSLCIHFYNKMTLQVTVLCTYFIKDVSFDIPVGLGVLNNTLNVYCTTIYISHKQMFHHMSATILSLYTALHFSPLRFAWETLY